jgi:hypothetical protein
MQVEVQHSYLYTPGLWDVAGIYYDVNNNAFPQKGTILVTHEPDLWVIEAQLTITTEQTQQVASRYEIQPPAKGASFTEWKSETGGPEPVYGLFVLVGDTIMSPWQSRSGAYWGQEVLTMVNENDYQARGFAFLENEKVSAWSTRLMFNG